VDWILREVRWCIRDDIRVSVFMLDFTPHLAKSLGASTVPTRAGIFHPNEDLEDYVLVDFMEHRRVVS